MKSLLITFNYKFIVYFYSMFRTKNEVQGLKFLVFSSLLFILYSLFLILDS